LFFPGDKSIRKEKNMNIVTICASLRKGSYNRMLMNTCRRSRRRGMKLKEAPAFDGFPLYNTDLHADGKFPENGHKFADAIRAADGVVIVSPEYNYTIPGAFKNAVDWVSRMKDQPFKDKARRDPVRFRKDRSAARACNITCARCSCSSALLPSTRRKFSWARRKTNSTTRAS